MRFLIWLVLFLNDPGRYVRRYFRKLSQQIEDELHRTVLLGKSDEELTEMLSGL